MVELTSTFIGRQKELEALRNSMQNVLNYKGSVVLLSGEAGIGKSELVNQFLKSVDSLTGGKTLIAQTRCSKLVGDTEPFLPFFELFDDIFIENGKKRVREELLDTMLDIAPDIASLIPGVGSIISGIISIGVKLKNRWKIGQKKEHLLERKDISQQRFFSEFTKALKGASSIYPLVLIIDDLQWTDESSANLLFYLSQNIVNCRILIIGAYRPEELNTPRARQPHPLREILPVMKCYRNVSTINLGFLKRKNVSAYISAVCPNHSFPQDFIDFVYTTTEGNSLFVVELVRLLKEDRTIAKEGTKWLLVKESIDIKVPERVEDVIERRISNILDETHRKLHEYASVEGEKFTSDVLSELLLIDKIDLSRQLRMVAELYNLVKEAIETSIEIGSYQFIHSLIHHSLYERLGREERILLHRKIGEILEAKYESDDRIEEFASILAFHFQRGLIFDKALKYLRVGADAAENTNSFVEALSLYRKATEIMAESEVATPKERVEILIKMGTIYQILGQGKEALDTLRESLNLNADIGDELIEASNLTNLGITLFYLGEFAESIDALERARSIYEHHKEELSEETLETYGVCLDWLGVNYRNYWKLDKSKEFHQKALDIAKYVNSHRLEAHAIANLGAIYLWQKDFSEVIDYWKQSLEISKSINDLPWIAHYAIDLGYMYFLERNYDEAINYLEEGTRVAQESYFEENFARGLMNQGNVWFAKGNLERAMRCYQEA